MQSLHREETRRNGNLRNKANTIGQNSAAAGRWLGRGSRREAGQALRQAPGQSPGASLSSKQQSILLRSMLK